MKLLLLGCTLLFAFPLCAQGLPESPEVSEITQSIRNGCIRMGLPADCRMIPFIAAQRPTVLPTLIGSSCARREYPLASLRRGESGGVSVRARLSADGIPQSVEVTKSSGFERLDQAAMNNLMSCRFTPGFNRDKPIPVDVVVPYIWTLEPSAPAVSPP
jgi:TonB family protein